MLLLPCTSSLCGCRDGTQQWLLGLGSASQSTVPEGAGLLASGHSSSVGPELALGAHQFNPLLVLLELLAQLC